MSTKKQDRREVLLRVASEVFAAKGYHEAKMDDIAAAADVAKGTLYLYFQDKRGIFTELIDGLAAQLSTSIIPVDTEADVVEQVKHNIRAVIGVLAQDPHVTSLLFDQASGVDEGFRHKMDSFYDGLKALLSASLEEGQRLGIVKEGDTRLYASMTVGGLREVLNEAAGRTTGKRTREQVVEAIFGMLQGGYLRLDPERKGPTRRVYATLGVATKPAKRRRATKG
ncbi:MAG: TetR/AcrR family transcriptional regulator [Deltaproteobacteria bacterium]|nr:TetR/AcrR family transcriptional regulator [Deltaproteobacteria bacterium]